MYPRVRAVLLAAATLVVLVPATGAAALAAHSGPSVPRTTVSQPLTWAIVPSPNRIVRTDVLTAISCPSASACIAVGSSSGHRAPRTLIESWNGTAWSIVHSPSRAGVNILQGVSCTSAGACTAVGYSWVGMKFRPKTLIESWNGSAWSIVPSRNPGRLDDELSGVSCISASACTAVGYRTKNSGNLATLVESWNGTAWSVVPSPSPPTHRHLSGHVLTAVSCVSATACTAVGGSLVESWNGATWSVVPSPSKGGLFGISCTAADACTAVGSYAKIGVSVNTLVESWNGTTWSVVPSPNPSSVTDSYNALDSVSCTAADACTAVGGYQNPVGTPGPTLIESWNGTAWSIVPSPSTGGPHVGDNLAGVSCPSGATCMAAGATDNFVSQRQRTLTELGTSSG